MRKPPIGFWRTTIETKVTDGANCELFSCREGNRGQLRERRMQLAPGDLLAPRFEFREKALSEIVRPARARVSLDR